MQFLTGRFVEQADYAAQDFDSIMPGPITIMYGEISVGTVALLHNSFVDPTSWAGNDMETLPVGATTSIDNSATNNSGGVSFDRASRFV